MFREDPLQTAKVRADEQFSARDIGNALARLHDIDGLNYRLSPALDDEGNVQSFSFR